MPTDLRPGEEVILKTARSGWDHYVVLGPSRKGLGWYRVSRVQRSGKVNSSVEVVYKNDLRRTGYRIAR